MNILLSLRAAWIYCFPTCVGPNRALPGPFQCPGSFDTCPSNLRTWYPSPTSVSLSVSLYFYLSVSLYF